MGEGKKVDRGIQLLSLFLDLDFPELTGELSLMNGGLGGFEIAQSFLFRKHCFRRDT